MIWQETHDEKGQILAGSWLPQSLTQAHMYPLNFKHQQHNVPGNVLMEEFNKQIFHLWGAKDFYDRAEKENEPELFKTWDDLKLCPIHIANDNT